MLRPLLVLIFLLFVPFAQAIDPLPFANDAEEQRFQHLASELRCLVCQNQNIADSDAGLAKDLRNQVREMVQRGDSQQQIIDYMTARYGDFVLYRPPFKSTTLVLWIGPIVILVIGFAIARNMMLRSGPHPDLPGPIDDKVDR